MGRSVSVPSNAYLVAYKSFENEDPYDAGEEWDAFKGFLLDVLTSAFPSFEKYESWESKEDLVIAESDVLKFGVSEYCGLVSVWMVPVDGEEQSAAIMASQFNERFEGAFGELRLIGRASNGEAFFEQVSS